MRLNLGCGKKVREGWLNVDKRPMLGVDQVVDLFAFPWPWESDSCEEIFCSHLVEHIPHEIYVNHKQPWPTNREWVDRLMGMDGFFAFFAECWRVMKDGGTIECVAPYGQSRYALQDPTHTRSIVPATVNYLVEVSGEGQNFDYDLPFRFAFLEGKEGVSVTYDGVTALIALSGWGAQYRGDIDVRLDTLWNQASELRFTLKAVKS